MQGLIGYILLLAMVSPILCLTKNVEIKMIQINVMNYGARGDGKSDDSRALLSAWMGLCGAEGGGTLVIPAQKIFMVTRLDLVGPCKAKTITIEVAGKIVAPAQSAWVGDKEKWISISKVNGLTINGNGGIINGYGSTWWQCKNCPRPRALSFHACNGLNVMGLTMVDSPGSHISVNACQDARFSKMHITAPADSPNTDGFDISSSNNILIEDSTIGTGDDCIAINTGSSHINITGIACGPGHGISVGSLGKGSSYGAVEEVYVRNCSFSGTQNGARIKTWQGGSGYARKITFEQITVDKVKKPIVIDQSYVDVAGGSLEVRDVLFRGFEGTSSNDRAIDLECSSPGCYNIILDHINIDYPVPGKKAYAFCTNAYGTASVTVPKVTCLLK